MRHLSKEWPVTIIAIVVDVAVNMKCTLVTPIPGHHGIMAKCDFMTTIVDLGHELYRNEMIRKVDSLYPIFIMVSDDQMLDPFELMKIFLRRNTVSEEHITQYVHDIITVNSRVPIFD